MTVFLVGYGGSGIYCMLLISGYDIAKYVNRKVSYISTNLLSNSDNFSGAEEGVIPLYISGFVTKC